MASTIRYDGQVVVITGAGNGIGKQYAKFFGARGAKVVVNDLGGTFNGKPGASAAVADVVVKEIRDEGGEAVADYNNVLHGEKIIQTAIDKYGRVDVLVNNAGILRDITIRNMKDEDWDIIMDVHVTGTMKTCRAAWPHMRKQKYGKIVNTTSHSGLLGNFGYVSHPDEPGKALTEASYHRQSNYAAAKMCIVGFTETLAKEGAKHNIHCNVLAPAAGSRLTQTVWPPEMMEAMNPATVVPLVGTLVHKSISESGSTFEGGAAHYSKWRWQRSKGFLAKPDDSLTPDVLLRNWNKVTDFTSGGEYATNSMNPTERLEAAMRQPSATRGDQLNFKGRVALVTGGGAGLGRAYAMLFAKLGAKVVVNDVKGADEVVTEIRKAKGEATASKISVEDGDAVVKSVIDAYGRIDIVVNNAGILRDKAFQNMTDELWFPVMNVHLRGTYKVTKAAWPHFMKQKYGRIVSITSTTGIYGNFGQANYAAAKSGIIGFTTVAAREGQKYNIIANTLAPTAGSNMTRTVWPPELVDAIKPEYVAPIVAALCSEKPPANAKLFEAGAGFFAQTRWQRARGVDFEHAKGTPSVEEVHNAFAEICNFDNGQADYPDVPADGSKYTMGNILRNPKMAALLKQDQDQDRSKRKYLNKQYEAMQMKSEATPYSYTQRDVILYNIGVGAKHTELDLVFEGSDKFTVLPTFGVVPCYFSKAPYKMDDILPNFDYRQLLHGEQYLEIRKWPIPLFGTLKTDTKLVEVVDKGNAAVVVRSNTTTDELGQVVFYNEGTSFIRKAGGFGGGRKPKDRGAATAANNPPSRSPDKVVEETTPDNLAAIYRLMGDYNPLHIDPKFSKVGGFDIPILHGLATFGVSGKHVYQAYGPFKNIKVRFAGTVLPGQTIVTEMWKEGGKVIYRVKVKETGKPAISNAAAELMNERANL